MGLGKGDSFNQVSNPLDISATTIGVVCTSSLRGGSWNSVDAQYLRFSDGKDGVTEILEYMKAGEADGDEGEEEEPEMEFDFNKKEILAAAELLERALRFRPDFEAALPLGNQLRKFRGELKQEIEENKVQTQISSFFSPVVPWASPEGIPYEQLDCIMSQEWLLRVNILGFSVYLLLVLWVLRTSDPPRRSRERPLRWVILYGGNPPKRYPHHVHSGGLHRVIEYYPPWVESTGSTI
ncbi:hypothetical protein B0H14DRAFT_2637265 [Mycena olivaceomarginata]|nr:hypothetical protein B0H14DRAFT_2637265 [Mycena olivaceomarginata]